MARNFAGFVLRSSTIINNHVLLVFAAEALASFQAVQAGLDLGFLEADIEGGALTVLKLNANNQDGSVISAYIYDGLKITQH